MLNQLEDIALSLNMSFGFGDNTALEAKTKELTQGFLLFHEGYFTADLNQDGQGALEYRHQLALDILVKSYPTDKAEQRRVYLEALDLQMRRVYKSLTDIGEIRSARVQYGLNATSTNLDFVKLTITLLTPALPLCNL